jgi:ketosteroid isomerase-like protein
MTSAGGSQISNLALVFDWIAALRKGDIDAITELLDPDVVWHGVCDDLVCAGRENVVDALREQVPMSLEADAIELINAPRHVVVGTRSEHLPQPPGIQLTGQVFNVFEQREGRFIAIRDFTGRDAALSAAGAQHKATAWR